MEVPLGLDHPYWIEDPTFDLDFHVRHLGLPPPGSHRQLAEQVSRIVARPLDRNRPLWELYVIEGLEGGYSAQLTKIHHCTIDGVSGAEILATLLDITPEPDGVVHWSTCLEAETERAENIEVPGSHCGLGFNPLVLYAVADRLSQQEGRWRPFDRSGWRQYLYR